jgi:hypothetical protein
LPWLASNHDPPDLCLLSSQDYRHELYSWYKVFLKNGGHGSNASVLLFISNVIFLEFLSLYLISKREMTMSISFSPFCFVFQIVFPIFVQGQSAIFLSPLPK